LQVEEKKREKREKESTSGEKVKKESSVLCNFLNAKDDWHNRKLTHLQHISQ
jgi:hypothetical protein